VVTSFLQIRHTPILAAALLLAGGPLAAQTPESRGLDVVVLVDVSSSMFRSPQDEARGADRERIRWDAVKLAADLLAVDDRLMIQRFNHECPPDYRDDQERVLAFFDADQKRPLLEADDFPQRLIHLVGQERTELENRVAQFNTTSDWLGSLDRGETGIVNALNVIARRIGRPAPGRQTHVVLLTDGVDSNHGDYASLERLRQALSSYTGDRPGHEPIPIHTIGLGLTAPVAAAPTTAPGNPGKPGECRAADDSAAAASSEGRHAEQFLLRISALTSGNYYRAQTNRDLIRIFLSLIRDLKGAWFQQSHFDPAPGGEREIGPTPVSGIVDLGALAFEIDPGATGPRTTAPLSRPLATEWIGLAGALAPQPVRRTGKNGAAYDYYYFGKTSRAETEKSPFAELPRGARLALTAPGSERPQEIILVKKTQDALFAMQRPEEGARFYRNQALKVELRMAESAFFEADQFEATARLLCAGNAGGSEAATPLAEVALAPDAANRRFTGAIPLGALVPGEAPVDYYTLAVTVRGKPQTENSLGGFQLDLPPRTIAVDNTLLLEPVSPIELTETQSNKLINIAASHPVHDDLTLQARFVPFQRDGRPVELKSFGVFDVIDGRRGADNVVSLQKGNGVLAIGFGRGAELPEGGVVYQPGKIIITGGEGARMAPLEIEVGLRIALAKIGVEPSEMQLEARPTPTAGPVAKVSLTPADQANTGIGKIRLEIRRARQTAGGPQFAPAELWLQAAGEPIAVAQRTQSLAVDLNAPFQVFLHPQQAKDAGKYEYEIAVSGRGIDEARVPLTLSVDAPVLEAKADHTKITLDPGASGVAEFELRLQGLSPESHPVYLRLPGGSPTVSFENIDPQAASPRLDLRVNAADEFNPLRLSPPDAGGQGAWTTFPIRVEVPQDAPFGRYRAGFTVASPKTADLPLSLEVVVNSLLVEMPTLNDEGEPGWRAVAESPILQFLGHEMEKTFRVRTGTGEPLSPEQIEVSPLRPFSDEAGDSMRLPQVASVVPGKPGEGLLVRLLFPGTPNAHVDLPYRVQVEVRSPELQLKPATAAFRVRFWNPLDFFDQTLSTPSEKMH
jgi:hypothetical protein